MKKIHLYGLFLGMTLILLAGLLPTPHEAQAAASCSPVTATISSGFSTGGAGEFCWVASDLGAYVQSWGTDILQINGVDYTNVYATTDSILRDTTGKFYVYYKSTTASGHFQATGSSGITSCSARWCSASQFSSMLFAPYTMYNNVWGATSGTQTIAVQNYNDWSVAANFPETSGVKSYPNASLDLAGKTLAGISSCTSSFRITPPSSGSWEAAYDIWVPSEVMIWMYKNGAVGPIAQAWNDDGTPVAAATNVTVGGHTWNVYRGGSNVVSFVRTTNTTSGTVDVLAILNWIKNQGWISNTSGLGKFQFGYEITSAPNGLKFVVNDYSMLCGGLGTSGGSATAVPTNPPPTSVVVTNTPTRASTSVVPTNTPTRTSTRTNTPVAPTTIPTTVPTTAPTTAPTTVPTTAATTPPTTGTLKVQYRMGDPAAPGDNQIKPQFNIINTGSSAVALSSLKIRYYFTKESGASTFSAWCDYAVVGCGTLTLNVAALSPVKTGADSYIEVGFTGTGTIAAGGQSGEMQTRLNKTDWSNFTETGDYSYDGTKTAFADWTKVALYQNGTLVWGTTP